MVHVPVASGRVVSIGTPPGQKRTGEIVTYVTISPNIFSLRASAGSLAV
jgi:hypothetical protein